MMVIALGVRYAETCKSGSGGGAAGTAAETQYGAAVPTSHAEIADMDASIQSIMEKLQLPSPLFPVWGYGWGQGSRLRWATSPALILQTRFWLTLASLPSLASLDNAIWICPHGETRLQIPALCHLPCPPSTSAFETQPLPPTLPRSEQRASTTIGAALRCTDPRSGLV